MPGIRSSSVRRVLAIATTSWCHGELDMFRLEASLFPQKVTPFSSMIEQVPNAINLAYPSTSSEFHPLTTVNLATVRCPFSFKHAKLSCKRSHASLNSGRSISIKLSGVGASTLTYNCVTGRRLRIAAGCCPLVTRKVEISRSCKFPNSSLMAGYMMGSPTRDNAQCFTVWPSSQRSVNTPGMPLVSLIMWTCMSIALWTMKIGSSTFHFHSLATGFLWCLQQKTHLLAQAREGVASMH
mmetsp:Transcript_28537/g.32810  ORF Transcript_28537/g.32810 Transcript_28537/m.32810 type:complete len:239 (-) Transcript_28537:530-1246(-)